MAAISWENPSNGDWSVATNWSAGAAPSLLDSATISAPGSYTVTISGIDVANSLTFDAPQASLVETAIELIMVGALTVESGSVSLTTPNVMGSVALSGGVIAFSNGGALGTGTVSTTGGELLATASLTLSNKLTFSGTSTIAAAHGVTLSENSTSYTIGRNTTLDIGTSGQDGTILWSTSSASSVALPTTDSVDVQAGTLKAADGQFSTLMSVKQTTVAGGATIDTAGFSITIADLLGGGSVTDSGSPATLTLAAANFSGTISGALSLVANGAIILAGANTYTGTTTIQAADGLQLGSGGATGSIAGSISDAGTLTIDRSDDVMLTNAVSGAGTLRQMGTGVTSINTANTYTGGTTLSAGTLAIGNSGALGTGPLTVTNGELLGTASETLANDTVFSASGSTVTLAAAPNTTLTLTGALTLAKNDTINIGTSGQAGKIIWESTPGNSQTGDKLDLLVGVLTAGGSELGAALSAISETTVEAGATLDWAGNIGAVDSLNGPGAVTNSGAPQTMTLNGAANFSGTISGALSLVANGAIILTGANTYTGTTTIQAQDSLQLGSGGTTGSILGGDISDAGTLTIDRSDDVTLTNAVSGAGALRQMGTGVTSINTANTYTGGTTLSAGTLAIGNSGALGTGALTLMSGELLGNVSETLANKVNLSNSGSTTLAAAPNTTLVLTGALTLGGNDTIDIDAPGQDGKIVWESTPGGDTTGDKLDVLAGTLTAGSSGLDTTLRAISGTTIEAGATLDWDGNIGAIQGLEGAGTVTNSGAAQTMSLNGVTNFSGTISGALSLVFNANATLSGLEDVTGATTLNGPITLTNSGTYEIVAAKNIVGTAASSFINKGDFEKTGGDGVSIVSSSFVNDGVLDVLSGSIKFTGGFTNNGVVHGLVTQSGGVTTVSAQVPSDFNGDGFSDILWQNTDGQAQIWEMNGTSPIAGGTQVIDPNPGPAWSAVGAGDFYGDGDADILWQNANGQVSIWEMDGTTRTGGGAVSTNPGPQWQAIGTGDFNSDGLSDILFQNTSTGQVSIWEMDGNTRTGGGAVSVDPGPAWKAIGTGDFYGNGDSDILWQNTSTGQVSIWEMNGTNVIGGGAVASSPGPAWQAIGTGDFNDDGHSDILFQNTSTGQLSVWEMDGNTRSAGGAVSVNPGTSWKAVGTGDFTADGFSDDILLQNMTSGQVSIWEMNGNKRIGGGAVSPNLGTGWHAIT
jgi:autotransporter-associated beta strand protein